ncbi:MAG: tyrosine-protein phosphatase [Atopobiaceae bacterium]|nr:tyrosine-protein phosphatase [Atopobiaceae bacterium]MBR3313372.1 tyrosine-protein phosphatase [Atopobiaceae bacterium]
MDPYERSWVRLPLDGACNVRELGGHPTANGEQTLFHRFLRSDSLSMLTARDERFLYDYGVRAILDLRDPSEVADDPDRPIGPDVVSANIPLLSYNLADTDQASLMNDPENISMANMYRLILENYEAVRACMRFIADAPEGCVLFHCAVGKDRTGVLAMLLLSLAGVDKWDIVADYVQTRPNLMRSPVWHAQWEDYSLRKWRPILDSQADVIEQTYDLMNDEHEGVENFLLECGVRDEDVAAVRRRLVKW